MEPLVAYLKKYSNNNFLNEHFAYTFPISSKVFDSHEQSEISSKGNWLEKNVYIKHLLTNKLNKHEQKNDYYSWIINDWGGIKSFKVNEKNIQRIKKIIC